MQVHSFFSHHKNFFFPSRQNKKEIQYEGIGVILTFVTKYFHKWKVACATFAYMKVETLDLQKHLLCNINFFARICGPQKCHDCTSTWPKLLLQLMTMICLHNKINKDQLLMNNQCKVCKINMVFIGMIPFFVLIFYRTFP